MQAPLDRLLDRQVRTERTLGKGAPSRPLLGVLPLARLIPQDVHSILDYINGVAVGSGAMMTDHSGARFASVLLGATKLGVSTITDYRVSVAKLVPVEVHSVLDQLWGVAAISAPFVFGYWKRAPHVAITHVVAGAAAILTSLFTDYRSAKRHVR